MGSFFMKNPEGPCQKDYFEGLKTGGSWSSRAHASAVIVM